MAAAPCAGRDAPRDDGVLDVVDNCPEVANADQADDDKDGKGNACDVCPTEPNPGMTKCVVVFTAKQLRDPLDPQHPAAKTRVRVKDMYVTGVRKFGSNRGFFAQSGTDAYSGLYVDTGNTSPTARALGAGPAGAPCTADW